MEHVKKYSELNSDEKSELVSWAYDVEEALKDRRGRYESDLGLDKFGICATCKNFEFAETEFTIMAD